MSKFARALAVGLILTVAVAGCRKEKAAPSSEPASFTFIIYPGARYLPQLTELTKQSHKIGKPSEEPPPTAIYDVDAPVETVAEFYAKSYGYSKVAADATNNLSAAKPAAYYRNGDLAMDVKNVQPLLQKMNVKTDISKAVGKYKAAEIEPRPNRPRVTVQRPYFDVTTSQVVDRTMILMAR
jgi:hypothetical protein